MPRRKNKDKITVYVCTCCGEQNQVYSDMCYFCGGDKWNFHYIDRQPVKPKNDFLSGYKTYDDSKGFGSAYEWKTSFRSRIDAFKDMTVEDALAVLGLSGSPTVIEIKAAFRKLAMKYHPDRSKEPDAEQQFKKLVAANAILTQK
jgi:hypothetical protein